MAISRRGASAGLLRHSDRGVQYADAKTRELAEKHGMECSMSRKGNCWDNAVVESFWASLKTEIFDDYVPATREEARKIIFEWIEIWYNRQRIRSTLGYLTPEQFELFAVCHGTVLLAALGGGMRRVAHFRTRILKDGTCGRPWAVRLR